MVYAKGHEEDEKLHKSFHQSVVQGVKFQVQGAAALAHSSCQSTQLNSAGSNVHA